MPALNFKKQFAKRVESGEKRQTIRKSREDCRNPNEWPPVKVKITIEVTLSES